MKRQELAQLLEITPVQLDTLLSNYPLEFDELENVPDDIAQQLLTKFENARSLAASQDTQVNKSTNITGEALAKIDSLISQYKSSSTEFVEGLNDQALAEQAFLGELSGRVLAITRLNNQYETFESILSEVSLANSQSTLEQTSKLLKQAQQLHSNQAKRVQAQLESLGKYEDITGESGQ